MSSMSTALRRRGGELAQRLNIAATLPVHNEFVEDYPDEFHELRG